jgi:hypothetical protein
MSKGDRLDRGRTQPCSMVMKNLAVPPVVLVVRIVLVILIVLVVLVVLVVLIVLVVLVVLVILVVLAILAILMVLVGRGSEVQFEPAHPPDIYAGWCRHPVGSDGSFQGQQYRPVGTAGQASGGSNISRHRQQYSPVRTARMEGGQQQ